MYLKACKEYGVHPVAYFHNALKTEKCILRHRQMTSDEIKAIAVALVVRRLSFSWHVLCSVNVLSKVKVCD